MAKTIKKAQAGLKASTKRVGPVDPNGAWTKVQEMNLPPRNVKTKASLTLNKKQGATRMKKGGVVKAQKGKVVPTPDSTDYYNELADRHDRGIKRVIKSGYGTIGYIERLGKLEEQARADASRQKLKGKPGYDANGFPVKKKSGVKSKAKEGKWIQKAINPKHKGYCTPMTKKTCTPKRKALAMTLKKMAKSRKGK